MSSNNSDVSEIYVAEKFRIVELILVMVVSIMTQVVWVTFAPIAIDSASFYGVDEGMIVLLSALFMIAYIPMNFPACAAIDKFGLKWGIGIGVILTCAGAVFRAVAGSNYWVVFTGQLLAAIGQPFVLNSYTKLGTTWFLEKEKTTAAGLGTISTLLGAIFAMVIPSLLPGFTVSSIPGLLWGYAIFSIVATALYFIFARDKPKELPNAYADKTKVLVTTGTKDLFKTKDFVLLTIMVLLGLGAFNAITSQIDLIFPASEGYDSGLISAAMIFGGVMGAIILSGISDSLRKRKIFLILAFLPAVPLSILLGLVSNPVLLYITSFLYGFLLVSALPVGMTYAAEITYPIPEESSAGVLMLAGQVSGLLLLLIDPGFFPQPNYYMIVFAGIFIVGAILSFFIKDTPYHESLREKQPEAQ